MKLLLDEIDKKNWMIADKNGEIQNLVNDKRELKKYSEEVQL